MGHIESKKYEISKYKIRNTFHPMQARLYINFNFEYSSRICNHDRYTDPYFHRSFSGTLLSSIKEQNKTQTNKQKT